ncbi:hypothetical protein NQ186_11550 [Pseudomonas zeae]|uniref:hypothetical protein n=1 Tax=Pseudomonas zeae TaxID=2745510 RepID=UPI0021471F6B|nr:hypothetical protein [Pseudomonas zeae]UUT14774.1 hypothetical protein NQ186_11550 [Pseudomonas zeae]
MRQCLRKTRKTGRCKRVGPWWFFCEEHRSLNLMAKSVAAIGFLSAIVTLSDVTPADLWNMLFPPSRGLLEVTESASIEGVKYSMPGSENVIAKVMTRATLDHQLPEDESMFLFTLVSPFKPVGMDTIFRGNTCWLMGMGRGVSDNADEGYIDITGITCVDDRGISYELHAPQHDRLGFVTNVGDLVGSGVKVIHDADGHTLRQSDNVMIRFDQPIASLGETGRAR